MLTGGALQKAMLVSSTATGDARAHVHVQPGRAHDRQVGQLEPAASKGGRSAGKPAVHGAGPQTVQMEIWFDAWDAAGRGRHRSVKTSSSGPSRRRRRSPRSCRARRSSRSGGAATRSSPDLGATSSPSTRSTSCSSPTGRRSARARRHPRGGPGGPAEAEPVVRIAREPPEPPRRRRRQPRLGRLARVRGRRTSGAGSPPSTRSTIPLRVAPGTRLLVPSVDEARRTRQPGGLSGARRQRREPDQVEVDGQPLDGSVESALVRVVVDDHLHLPDTFEVTLQETPTRPSPRRPAEVGTKVEVSARPSERAPSPADQRRGHGARGRVRERKAPLLVVRGYDHAHRLSRAAGPTRSSTKYSDIAQTIASEVGSTSGPSRTSAGRPDHVLQADRTDWEFLSDLADEIGFEVAVTEGSSPSGSPAAAEAPAGISTPATRSSLSSARTCWSSARGSPRRARSARSGSPAGT